MNPRSNAYVQGVLAYQSGDTAKAMTNLQDAVNKNNDLVMARSMLGDLYRSRSDYECRPRAVRSVARLDPYDYSNHYRLGLVYQFLDRLQEAAASYLKALNLKPDDAPSNMSLGTVYSSSSIEPSRRRASMPSAPSNTTRNPPPPGSTWGWCSTLDERLSRGRGGVPQVAGSGGQCKSTQLYLGENLLAQKKI